MEQIIAVTAGKSCEVMIMKKYFNYYLIVLAICFVVFNVVVWVIPNELYGYEKTTGGFWPSYIFINIALIGMIPCGYIASKSENKEKLFLNIPILTVSYTALTIMFIAGTVCMAVPKIADWVGLIVCLVILGLAVIAVISAKAAASVVESLGKRTSERTEYIKELSSKANNVINLANTDISKGEAKKVYEAIRYSDPMSDESLLELETQITVKFNEFVNAINSADDVEVTMLSKAIQTLLAERNSKCKIMK